jgi:hypothetical protein
VRSARVIALAALLLSHASSHQARDRTLDIEPVWQETPLWCWAAVGEMVFRYYDVPTINPAGDFQCGIVSLLNPACASNCRNCPVGAGSLTTISNMIKRYPVFAGGVSRQDVGRLSAIPIVSALSTRSVMREIDAGRPVVAGISPTGFALPRGPSQHVALIIGYEGDEDDLTLVVNDPYPFSAEAFASQPNPYEAAGGEEIGRGRYSIEYGEFRARLRWRESIYGISCAGTACPSLNAPLDATTKPSLNLTSRPQRTSNTKSASQDPEDDRVVEARLEQQGVTLTESLDLTDVHPSRAVLNDIFKGLSSLDGQLGNLGFRSAARFELKGGTELRVLAGDDKRTALDAGYAHENDLVFMLFLGQWAESRWALGRESNGKDSTWYNVVRRGLARVYHQGDNRCFAEGNLRGFIRVTLSGGQLTELSMSSVSSVGLPTVVDSKQLCETVPASGKFARFGASWARKE